MLIPLDYFHVSKQAAEIRFKELGFVTNECQISMPRSILL